MHLGILPLDICPGSSQRPPDLSRRGRSRAPAPARPEWPARPGGAARWLGGPATGGSSGAVRGGSGRASEAMADGRSGRVRGEEERCARAGEGRGRAGVAAARARADTWASTHDGDDRAGAQGRAGTNGGRLTEGGEQAVGDEVRRRVRRGGAGRSGRRRRRGGRG
jgi:hypothetical protein